MGKASTTEMLTSEEMLAAQGQVFHQVMGYMGAMSLRCVIELNVPEIICAHGRPLPHSDLLSKLPTISPAKTPFVGRIMRLLAQMGYFKIQSREDGEASYSLTPLSTILLKDRPTSLASWVLGSVNPNAVGLFQVLGDWLKADQPGCTHEFVLGKSMWDLANEVPEYNTMVNEFMAGDSRVLMKVVVEQCSEAFQGLKTLVDVGGGTGITARTIAHAFPGLRCTVYDLPHVIATVPESTLVDAVGGNMFEHIPRADAIFLKLILHDWTDEDCVKILKKCKDAIPPKGGKVIIVDIVLNDRKDSTETVTQLFWDMAMLTAMEGKEREEHEWKMIFTEAGFSDYTITPVGIRSLIEVFP